MTQAVADIIGRITLLSPAEREEVAYAALRMLEPEEEGVAEAWDAELSRRIADIRAGRISGKPAEEFFAELRKPEFQRCPSL